MKKVLFILMMCAAVMTAVAQEHKVETMTATYVKADKMAKTQGSTKWKSDHVAVTLWDNGDVGMGLINPPHIFVGGRDFMGNHKPTNTCKVGLYTADGELVWMADGWKVMPGQGGTVLYFTGSAKAENQQNGVKQKITTTEILKWLQQQPGNYVRYIADVYGDYYWDVSVSIAEE